MNISHKKELELCVSIDNQDFEFKYRSDYLVSKDSIKGKGSRFPRTHLEESESEYKINFELPGMSKSDVSIHWKSGNTLVLTANKQVEEVSQDKKII
ncbi:hypothetical protein DLAC_08043 [Tieghemostelium lacteum]|uniref:SHSP domain-containing protein n=1 Tax=Tieghemostelium lacteum TaxID=361077 RepID=A0A151ZB26_TIELA|nr:hypothetical protein DLAC_08043 [Tieghemostelium lacteum]|eukprot:KYQ91136.1 hypothetical protein DLAC_08043 [Tieghemostelium lacteum]